MRSLAFNLWAKFLVVLSIPLILSDYFSGTCGRDYGVALGTKLVLMLKMFRNTRRITTASSFIEHLLMAAQILRVPRSVPGCVVECGSFKGGSAANLSLVCALCDRALEIFDSFQGLPEPGTADSAHILVWEQQVHTYEKGAWCGTLEEVKRNITRCGEIGVCRFHVGYFDQTLPDFKQTCILAFVDVDLRESLETCLRYLWPVLADGAYFFTHEAPHVEIASVFFDRTWWGSVLGCDAPGLVGAGNGLGLVPASGGFGSEIGYTVKNPSVANFAVMPQTGSLT